MPDDLRVILAFATAMLVAVLATPAVRRLAVRTDFYDHPVGYKRHERATPYLGGAAVIAAFVVAAAMFADAFSGFSWVVVCTLGLLAVGTLDDRVWVGIRSRLVVEAGAALVLLGSGQGWGVLPWDAANLVL